MLRSLMRGFKIVADDLLRKHGSPYSTFGTIRRLEGKVAIITGGANGLGKVTAQEFINHGAQVIIADVDSDLGPQVATDLGPSAHFVHCDVVVEDQVKEAVNAAVSRYGKLDIMYNNVGITGQSISSGAADLNLDEFYKVMQINVGGAVAGIKHAARVMIPRGTGSILCTSSISGLMGGLGPHPYSISKFTIPGLVKSMAGELCKHGIRVNCISPGPIPTPLVVAQMAQLFPGATEEQIVGIINGMTQELKGAKCEEIDVAKAALFLASDEAKYITGHNLVVDGGFTSFKCVNLPSLSKV